MYESEDEEKSKEHLSQFLESDYTTSKAEIGHDVIDQVRHSS